MEARRGEADALGLLGLARRAGRVVLGVEAVRRALKAGEIRLVVRAAGASEAQWEKVEGVLRHRKIPVRWISGSEVLGRALGAGPVSVVGIGSPALAKQLLEKLPSRPPDSPGREGLREKQEESRSHAGR